MKNNKIEEDGFTLIELLVAMTILGVVMAGVTTLFVQTGRYHTNQEMMIEVAQHIRGAKSLMVDEIRSVGCNLHKQIRVGFQVDNSDDRFNTDANSIHFTRDIDNTDGDELYEPDGLVDAPNEDIRYYRVDAGNIILNAGDNTVGTLVRNTGGGGQTVAENVVDLRFRYFDEANVEIVAATMTKNAILDRIKTVEVTLVGQVRNTNRMSVAQRTWEQQFRVRVRNL